MSKLRLWGHPRSINVVKVLWTLDELGLEYERIDAGAKFGRVKDADYLSLNPNGVVPTLEDGSAALWESNAIVRYLAAKYGSPPFLPTELALRARADGWNEWTSLSLWPQVQKIQIQLIRTPEPERDLAQIAEAREKAIHALNILNRELGKTPYVAGDDFSFGDLPLAATAQRWFNLPIERPALKAVDAWYQKVKERPGFKRWADLPLA